MIIKEWCMYCGECSGVCPRGLIEVREVDIVFDKDQCKDCQICIKACPLKALEKED